MTCRNTHASHPVPESYDGVEGEIRQWASEGRDIPWSGEARSAYWRGCFPIWLAMA